MGVRVPGLPGEARSQGDPRLLLWSPALFWCPVRLRLSEVQSSESVDVGQAAFSCAVVGGRIWRGGGRVRVGCTSRSRIHKVPSLCQATTTVDSPNHQHFPRSVLYQGSDNTCFDARKPQDASSMNTNSWLLDSAGTCFQPSVDVLDVSR